jgi:hypothetical protein
MVTWAPGHLDTWTPGHLDTWTPGHLDTWTPGHLGTWAPGHLGTWAPGHLGTWCGCGVVNTVNQRTADEPQNNQTWLFGSSELRFAATMIKRIVFHPNYICSHVCVCVCIYACVITVSPPSRHLASPPSRHLASPPSRHHEKVWQPFIWHQSVQPSVWRQPFRRWWPFQPSKPGVHLPGQPPPWQKVHRHGSHQSVAEEAHRRPAQPS